MEQVEIHIMNRAFTIGTPESEKATLLQSVEMLNEKIETVKNGGRIVETDKIVMLAALNVVHDLLKMTIKDDLAIGDFERKITDMTQACDKALAKVN